MDLLAQVKNNNSSPKEILQTYGMDTETQRAKTLQSYKDEVLQRITSADYKIQRNARQIQTTVMSTLEVTEIPVPSQAEYDALIAFYNSTLGSIWQNNSGWNPIPGSPQNVEEWYGITVDELTGHILKIELPNNGLKGQLPIEISNLAYLETLDLQQNQINGTIPVGIGNLVNLTILNFDENNFQGTLPDSIGSLSQLVYLDISGGQLTAIPTSIGDLANLEFLDLSGNMIASIPSTIGALESLTYFGFVGNQLTVLPDNIGSLNNLEVLALGSNDLTSLPGTMVNLSSLVELDISQNEFVELPGVISSLSNLEKLDIQLNHITSLPASLSNLTRLKYITASNNNITGTIPIEIFTPMQSLFLLDLGFNEFSGPVPSNIGDLDSLAYLVISNNQLTDSIPSSIGNLSELILILASENQLSGGIPHAFMNLPKLSIVFINDNLLSGQIPTPLDNSMLDFLRFDGNAFTGLIPFNSSNSPILKMLWLQNNKLTGKIPDDLGTLTSLQSLQVENNKLTFEDLIDYSSVRQDQIFRFVPQDSVDQTKTIAALPGGSLTLSTSIDRTTTPRSKYQWFEYIDGINDVALQPQADTSGYIYLIDSITTSHFGKQYYYKITNENAPTLTLTSRIQTLIHGDPNPVACASTLAEEYHALMSFFAATNGTEWKFNDGWRDADPELVQSVTGWYGIRTDGQGFVTDIDLDGVTINGQADFTYQTINGFQVYPGNNLVGIIPAEIEKLCHLKTFNVGGNKLAGTLPYQIGNFPDLIWLIIANNQISGSIPATIGNLKNLNRFFADYNRLGGPLPDSLGSLPKLWALLIEHNQITGSIPTTVSGLKKLQYFHLFDNQLSGEIPVEVGGMTELRHFEVNDNLLTGRIPSTLGQISTMNYFRVENNFLEGTIPDSLKLNTALTYINVSGNRLSEEIPISLSGLTNLDSLIVDTNQFTFSDLLPLHFSSNQNLIFEVSPQDTIDVPKQIYLPPSGLLTLTTNIDRNTSPPSKYRWYRYVNGVNDTPLNQLAEESHTVQINVNSDDIGAKYYYTIINDVAEGPGQGAANSPNNVHNLVLISHFQTMVPTDSCGQFGPGIHNNWVFGQNAGISFNTTPPSVIPGIQLSTDEGSASVSDASGNLRFYTNGVTIWNRNHEVMPNGSGLMGHISSTQSVHITSNPSSCDQYYVFTTDAIENNLVNGIRYSVVDMSLNGGLGDVIEKNILLYGPAAEKITSIPSQDGKFIWLITHVFGTHPSGPDTFIIYKITANGVELFNQQQIGQPHFGGQSNINAVGYMKAANGRIALVNRTIPSVEIFNFDTGTGVLSNAAQLDTGYDKPYGLEFSSDGTKLYVSDFNTIFQYDLSQGSIQNIINSKYTIASDNVVFRALQIGPDEKIYIAIEGSNSLGIINNPNGVGVGANFVLNGLSISPGVSKFGLPAKPTIINFDPCQVIATAPDFSEIRYVCGIQFDPEVSKSCFATQFNWDFGDGYTSTDRSPIHVYGSNGTYNVSLQITYGCGACVVSASSVKQVTVDDITDLVETITINAETIQRDDILSASAVTFSDAWPLSYQEDDLNRKNGFATAQQGVWRNEGSYVYTTARKQSEEVQLKVDGTFEFEEFNWEEAEHQLVPRWTKANSMTAYSPYSYELENRDVLGVYSAALYDYGGQLPSANGVNMKNKEMAFTSFESDLGTGPTGNLIFGSQDAVLEQTFDLTSGRGHQVQVLAFPEELAGTTTVDIRGRMHGQDFFVENDKIICAVPSVEPGVTIIVLETGAPYDQNISRWSGELIIRGKETVLSPIVKGNIAHSGKGSMYVQNPESYKQPILELIPNKSYWISGWVSVNDQNLPTPKLADDLGVVVTVYDENLQPTILETFEPEGPVIEGWQQFKGSFVYPENVKDLELTFKSGSKNQAWYDDIRIHPEKGNMRSYVYNIDDYRLQAILDEENFASFFYYDKEGNLYLTKKETTDGIKTITENISYQIEIQE